MAAAALQEGEVFAGRYRIVRELASGGMGAVYEVVHTVTERRCALKVMLSHTVEREQLRKRFMQESRLAAQIGSEYIVDVLDAGVDDETKAPYLVMELLEGEDLGQRLVRLGPLSRQETVGFLWHAALALDRTHQAGIVHRDLKASNLFLTRREDGTPLVKVLDFGVAKVLTMERSGEQRTQTVGTPIYMAPEQFRAEGRISAATDIYALGMLSYTLLVGVHYWAHEHEHCENPFAFASIAVHGPKESPSGRAHEEGVDLPVEYDGWFFRSTSRWPQDRFPSATAAVAELAHVLGVEPPSASMVLPAPPDRNAPQDRSGTSNVLPATVEGESTRMSDLGVLRVPTPSPLMAHREPSSAAAQTEAAVSLSSGGFPALVEDREPRRSPMIVLGAVISIVVVAGGATIGLSLRDDAHEVVRTGATGGSASAAPNPSPSASATVAAPTAATVTPLSNLQPAPNETGERDVVRIDQLPKEVRQPTELPLARPPARAPRAERPSTPAPASTPAPVAPTPVKKPPDREGLYGRD